MAASETYAGSEREQAGRPDAGLVALARGTGLTLVGGVASVALGFAATLVITRGLGATGAGVFFVASAIFSILATLATLGADIGCVRTVARYRALGRGREIRTIVAVAMLPVLVLSTFLALAVVLLSDEIGDLFASDDADEVSAALRVLMPVLPLAVRDGRRDRSDAWPGNDAPALRNGTARQAARPPRRNRTPGGGWRRGHRRSRRGGRDGRAHGRFGVVLAPPPAAARGAGPPARGAASAGRHRAGVLEIRVRAGSRVLPEGAHRVARRHPRGRAHLRRRGRGVCRRDPPREGRVARPAGNHPRHEPANQRALRRRRPSGGEDALPRLDGVDRRLLVPRISRPGFLLADRRPDIRRRLLGRSRRPHDPLAGDARRHGGRPGHHDPPDGGQGAAGSSPTRPHRSRSTSASISCSSRPTE